MAPHAARTSAYGCRRSAPEGQLERTRTFYRRPQKGVALRMIGCPPSQSPDALDHLTHDRPRSKRRESLGPRSAAPKRVRQALARVEDLRDIDSRRDQHHHCPASTARQHPSHGRRRPHAGHTILVSESHPRQGEFGHQKIKFSPSLA